MVHCCRSTSKMKSFKLLCIIVVLFITAICPLSAVNAATEFRAEKFSAVSFLVPEDCDEGEKFSKQTIGDGITYKGIDFYPLVTGGNMELLVFKYHYDKEKYLPTKEFVDSVIDDMIKAQDGEHFGTKNIDGKEYKCIKYAEKGETVEMVFVPKKQNLYCLGTGYFDLNDPATQNNYNAFWESISFGDEPDAITSDLLSEGTSEDLSADSDEDYTPGFTTNSDSSNNWFRHHHRAVLRIIYFLIFALAAFIWRMLRRRKMLKKSSLTDTNNAPPDINIKTDNSTSAADGIKYAAIFGLAGPVWGSAINGLMGSTDAENEHEIEYIRNNLILSPTLMASFEKEQFADKPNEAQIIKYLGVAEEYLRRTKITCGKILEFAKSGSKEFSKLENAMGLAFGVICKNIKSDIPYPQGDDIVAATREKLIRYMYYNNIACQEVFDKSASVITSIQNGQFDETIIPSDIITEEQKECRQIADAFLEDDASISLAAKDIRSEYENNDPLGTNSGITLVCPNCGTNTNTKFCPECGTKMEEIAVPSFEELHTCPECGTFSESKHCPECGHIMPWFEKETKPEE